MGKHIQKYDNITDFYNKRGGARKYPNISFIKDTEQIIYSNDVEFPAYLYAEPIINKYILDATPVVRYTYEFDFNVENINDIYLKSDNFKIDEYMSEYNGKPTYIMDADKIEELQQLYPIYVNDSLLYIEMSSFYVYELPIKEFNDVLVAPSPYFFEDNYMIDCYGYIKDGKIIMFEEILDYEKLDKSHIYIDETINIDLSNYFYCLPDFYYLPDTTWQDIVYCEDNRQDYLNYLYFTIWRWMTSDSNEYPYTDNYVHVLLDEETDLILYYKDTNDPVLITDKLQETDYIIKLNKKLITFYVDNAEYQAEQGMTWEEWINSDYNYNNYAIIVDNIHFDKYSYFTQIYININSDVLVDRRDYILEKNTYALKGGGYGN